MPSHKIPLANLVGTMFLLAGIFIISMMLDDRINSGWHDEDWWTREWGWDELIFHSLAVVIMFGGVLLFLRKNVMRIFLVALLHISMVATMGFIFLIVTDRFQMRGSINLRMFIEVTGVIIGLMSPQIFVLFFLTQDKFIKEFKEAEEEDRSDLLDFY